MSGLTTPAWAIGADSHSADVVRMATQAGLSSTGVVGSGLAVTHVASALEVEVAPGQLYVPGTYGSHHEERANSGSQHATYSSLPANFTTQGSYTTWLPEAQKITVPTPSASHPRIDLVVVQVEDAEWSGALNQAVLSIVTGTAASSPVAPTPPESCVVLAQYEVLAGASEVEAGKITNRRPYATGIIGGIEIPVALPSTTVGAPHLVSATRPALVTLHWQYAVTGPPSWECKVKAGGVEVGRGYLTTAPGFAVPMSCTFWLNPGEEWEVTQSGNSTVEQLAGTYTLM